MNIIYNIAVNAFNGFLKLYYKCISNDCRRKFPMFVIGQHGLISKIKDEMCSAKTKPVVWFHCASLGEYGVARPLINQVKKQGDCTIVLTFFSPSGYRALEHKHPGVDHLFYLPLDTRRNARVFIDAIKPDMALFMVSEYWPNYLQQLKFDAIPTYLVSAIIRENSPFFRWYGRIYRKSLSSFSRIFVLNEESQFNLKMLGYTDVTVSGNSLFDNAALVARTQWNNEIIEHFAGEEPLFVAGSISDEQDLNLMVGLVKSNTDTRFVFVPHDLDKKSIDDIRNALGGGFKMYSECDAQTDFVNTQVLVVDTIGMLAYIYRYATWAYVGGGFTPLLHSVIEATVYGVPVAFGPRVERKVTPLQLIKLGIGAKVTNADELSRWFTELKNNPQRLDEIKKIASDYVKSNVGATQEIIDTVTKHLWAKK